MGRLWKALTNVAFAGVGLALWPPNWWSGRKGGRGAKSTWAGQTVWRGSAEAQEDAQRRREEGSWGGASPPWTLRSAGPAPPAGGKLGRSWAAGP